MEGLKITGVSFLAGGRTILDDVLLNVRRGETLALLGPSGSGKTTLLRIVAGLERPSAGSVSFGGVEVTGVAAHRRGFGMMFQDHALFPHMDVAGNIEFGLRQAHWSSERRAARSKEMLDVVGLAGFGGRSIERLSGGERQRVALARALAPGPGLLMLDEPLGSLDRGLRERLSGELREILSGLDVTAIYVTHDQAEAFTVADRVAVMNEGAIVRVGTPRDLWNEPQTEFVARFLGMENVVSGICDAAGFVTCAFGRFGPVEGPPGGVALLLRGEYSAIVPNPGLNVATGRVTSTVFRGATVEVGVSLDGVELKFALSGDDVIPSAGANVAVAVRTTQVLRAESPGQGK